MKANNHIVYSLNCANRRYKWLANCDINYLKGVFKI